MSLSVLDVVMEWDFSTDLLSCCFPEESWRIATLPDLAYVFCCFELIASLEYFVSQKTVVALIQNCFIDLRGAKDSNYPADLLVEHNNKGIQRQLPSVSQCGHSTRVIDRLSKSQSQTSEIMDNFCKEFAKPQFIGRDKANKEKMQRDVDLIIKSITHTHF